MMDMMNGGHGWSMGGMWFVSLIFWVLIIIGVVMIVRWLLDRRQHEAALEILKQRYARGEIDQETFARMKKDIEGG